jgi:hypothetical protein
VHGSIGRTYPDHPTIWVSSFSCSSCPASSRRALFASICERGYLILLVVLEGPEIEKGFAALVFAVGGDNDGLWGLRLGSWGFGDRVVVLALYEVHARNEIGMGCVDVPQLDIDDVLDELVGLA